jgi:hypothetical protein
MTSRTDRRNDGNVDFAAELGSLALDPLRSRVSGQEAKLRIRLPAIAPYDLYSAECVTWAAVHLEWIDRPDELVPRENPAIDRHFFYFEGFVNLIARPVRRRGHA